MTNAEIHALEGRELQEAVARRLGWKYFSVEHNGFVYGNRPSDGIWCIVPHWPESLNACLRDLWPVLRKQRWHWDMRGAMGSVLTRVLLASPYTARRPAGSAPGTDEVAAATAFCRAFLAATGQEK